MTTLLDVLSRKATFLKIDFWVLERLQNRAQDTQTFTLQTHGGGGVGGGGGGGGV